MKYAKEIIELMSAFPGRDFRPKELVRECSKGRELTIQERTRVRVGVWRVLQELQTTGVILVSPARHGASARYRWKAPEKCYMQSLTGVTGTVN